MKKKSILIVDDEVDVHTTLTKYLSREYSVHKAADGQEEYDIIHENDEIELILSDIQMPRMDGLELLNKIQESKKDIKTIFITGNSNIHSAADALCNGAFDYLIKPVDVSRLEILIKAALYLKRNNAMPCNPDDNSQQDTQLTY
jgi:DNA-binding NtrC family response regulator